MISIKDIAKECNVSVATVSKALNDHDDISAATKDKVRKAAQKLGYTTNVAARPITWAYCLPMTGQVFRMNTFR